MELNFSPPLPVISEGILLIVRVEGARWGKHDGSVKVTNDATDGTGRVDAGLRATGAMLEGGEDTRYLQTGKIW